MCLIFAQIAQALTRVHAKGIIHRDVKSSNIFVKTIEPISLCLGDFGNSINIDVTGESKKSLTRGLIGTKRYVAPEMLDPALRDYSYAIDVFALSSVMIHLCTFTIPTIN